MKTIAILTSALAAAALCQTARAHPIPDIPVRSTFAPDGKLTVLIEVDPRCFAEDPLNEPYLENAVLQTYSAAQKAELFAKTKALIDRAIVFHFEPERFAEPKFAMRFTTLFNQPLSWDEENPEKNSIKCAEMPVMVTASWTTEASSLRTYQVEATKDARFSVKIVNVIGEERQRLNVLFPGESSYQLDVRAWAASLPSDAESSEPRDS